jgi:hypothetical protein
MVKDVLLAVKEIDAFTTLIVVGALLGRPWTLQTLVNQMVLPASMAVPLKLEAMLLTVGANRSSSASK